MNNPPPPDDGQRPNGRPKPDGMSPQTALVAALIIAVLGLGGMGVMLYLNQSERVRMEREVARLAAEKQVNEAQAAQAQAEKYRVEEQNKLEAAKQQAIHPPSRSWWKIWNRRNEGTRSGWYITCPAGLGPGLALLAGSHSRRLTCRCIATPSRCRSVFVGADVRRLLFPSPSSFLTSAPTRGRSST